MAVFALAIAAIGLSGCKKNVECTAEVTAGAGSFKSTTTGEEVDTPTLRREAVREACSKMCAPEAGKEAPKGCAARCLVDAEAGKVGAKIDCVKAR
jgi:hypothetical protein